ncbi:phage portal protein [Magnetospirillum molischianum]|uniref:Portal protein n=1 Tax=Magnetospirillum molischianum DSM 120 TaxID=1150626 RepID=H8FY44_MAGML|nr:phage portal protein [Magnetospirillum molischianum]CCG43282.1 conserved hypothetical protein [Magnetospirillum molischianum DSM 120]
MPDFATADQKMLKRMIERRHPAYDDLLPHWQFLEACYEGGRRWFADNVFRYMKEGDTEFGDRVKRAYRFNHTREVVDLVNKYIFKADIIRNTDDAPEGVKRFWQRATRSNLTIDQFMKEVSKKSSIYGRVWAFVDTNMPAVGDGRVATLADEKKLGARVYSYIVTPPHVLDLGYDDEDKLNWIMVHESARDDADPLGSTGAVFSRFRLWTRTEWFLFELRVRERNKKMVELVDQGENRLGEVPCVRVDHIHSDDPYNASALIADIAYLDRAVANYLSNLDAIIQDQTFSQLAMPAQGMLPGEEGYEKILELGTKRIFTYDGEHGSKPEFIAPDPKQAGVVLDVINKIINEIYHTVGMAGERTKQDNAVGIDNSSGVAKAYDFERMNALLASKADSLDNAENAIVRLVKLYTGEKVKEDDVDLVKYPDSFDVRGLYDEFEVAERLSLIEAPDEVRREQMRQVIDKLWPRMAASLRAKLEASLKDWPPQPMDQIGAALVKGEGGAAIGSLSIKRQPQQPTVGASKDSTQGQNNKGAKTAA